MKLVRRVVFGGGHAQGVKEVRAQKKTSHAECLFVLCVPTHGVVRAYGLCSLCGGERQGVAQDVREGGDVFQGERVTESP